MDCAKDNFFDVTRCCKNINMKSRERYKYSFVKARFPYECHVWRPIR